MRTLKQMKERTSNIVRLGYGSYAATIKTNGKEEVVRFHDGELYDRLVTDTRGEYPAYSDTEKGTGGYTLRQAYEQLWSYRRPRESYKVTATAAISEKGGEQ